ncbi:putative disease resistance RPP13-like protein 1 [Chenopodium quinoa]|uniref:putative disease resistance RPP13-like protein 1 n=1 Tax=Chenopodium quinoa TaxID=63459 RepID=UPI000B78CAD9|nr:putative disease resistance RPP13-like protein 1 [Chenopodium quinoa]
MVMRNYRHNTIIYLKCLSDEDCWCIFQRHVNEFSNVSEMRDDIVHKCKGLPLAAKTLGGLLRKAIDKSHRQRILDSNIWSEESSVLPVLRLSYHHLPSHLKHLFAYCFMLPRDYHFQEMEIIKLWMAQGFLPENKNERIEYVGHNCFLDLVSRSLIEEYTPDVEEFIFEEGPRMFTMHDLIHDLAKWAAGDLRYVTDTVNLHNVLKRTRHMYMYVTDTGVNEVVENQLFASHLRTFLYSSSNDLNIEMLNYIQHFRYLRSLCLSSMKIKELPDCIGDLKHLKLLVVLLKQIKVLPKSISKLRNLQTLELSRCSYLQEIQSVGFLVKLRHLSVDYTRLKEMPLGIEKLKILQSLDKFVLAPKEVEDAVEARLHDKDSVDRLHLKWERCWYEVDDNTKRDVLEKLRPHTSIKECKLDGYRGSTLPSWLGDPSFINMVHIRLEECEKCEFLPPLGQLSSLKSLLVKDMNGITEKWVHSPVDNIGGAFPLLEMLSIKYCLSLQGNLLPHLPSLRTLEIKECKNLSVSLPSLHLLEVLNVDGCKILSTTADVIFCSKRMILCNILEIISLNWSFPYLHEEISIVNCLSVPITIDQISMMLRRLKICNCRELQFLELKNLSSSTSRLEELSVDECEFIVSISHIPLTLQSLEIDDCEKLRYEEFNELHFSLESDNDLKTEESIGVSPKDILELILLTKLIIQRFPSLISLQKGLLFPALQTLDLWDCENMEILPGQFLNKVEEYLRILHFPKGSLHLLRNLSLQNVGCCADLVECLPCLDFPLPSSLSQLNIKSFRYLKTIANGNTLPNLTDLHVSDCPKLVSLVSDFTSLTELSLESCPKFCNFIAGLSNVRQLSISGTNIEKPIQEWGLHLLTSLQILKLKNIGSSIECISGLELPSSLYKLHIAGLPNLTTLCCSTLPNLTNIDIYSCPKLESFGDNGLPPRNDHVFISNCHMIEQHLRYDPNGLILTLCGRCSLPLS